MALEQHMNAGNVVGTYGAKEIMLIPIQELLGGQVATIRNGAIKKVVNQASIRLNLAPDKLLVRAITPKADLDYTYETWYERTGTSSAAYETMSTGGESAKDRDRFIGIWGVMDSSPELNCASIRIKIGTGIVAIWSLLDLRRNRSGIRIGISPLVAIIPPNTPYTIERYVLNATSPARILLKGFVVERMGKTYAP